MRTSLLPAAPSARCFSVGASSRACSPADYAGPAALTPHARGSTPACRLTVRASATGRRQGSAETAAKRQRSALLPQQQRQDQQQQGQAGGAQGQQVASNIVEMPASPRQAKLAPAASSSRESSRDQGEPVPAKAVAAAEQPTLPVSAVVHTAAPEEAGNSSSGSSAMSKSEASVLSGMHKPVGLVVGSAWLLSATVQLTGTAALSPIWLPVVAGGALGGLYTALNHIGVRRFWRSPDAPLRVVVTGGTKGIGKALAREFLRCGDHVVVTGRSAAGLQAAVEQLREEVGSRQAPHRGVEITGVECDVCSAASIDHLVQQADQVLGGCDVWINCAGYSGSFQNFLDQPPHQIAQVVNTNLLGSLLASRAAMLYMAQQPGGGHVFNMEGAGADGMATPQYAAYGATKSGIAQLLKSLQYEAAELPTPVCVHNMSPGMVLTDLLLEGATQKNKQVFNILCEQPETVAAFLVPRARSVVARGTSGAAIRFLTPARVLAKLLTAPFNLGRYFDSEGHPVYLPERERLLGGRARRTRRLQQWAARRSQPLQLAYSLSMAVAFWMIVNDALAKSAGGMGGPLGL